MNTTTIMDDDELDPNMNPGIELANLREQKGYSVEYVANKLHLRVRIIELLEQWDVESLPQPVFIKGYLRAYSKLLGVSPEPFLSHFSSEYSTEKKPERIPLWQTKKETPRGEYIIRWVTILFTFAVTIAIGIWWQKDRDQQPVYSAKDTLSELSLNQNNAKEVKLTDLSKMQSLLIPNSDMSPMENQGA